MSRNYESKVLRNLFVLFVGLVLVAVNIASDGVLVALVLSVINSVM